MKNGKIGVGVIGCGSRFSSRFTSIIEPKIVLISMCDINRGFIVKIVRHWVEQVLYIIWLMHYKYYYRKYKKQKIWELSR